jgi:3',5'-cyclic AMP phosphodiesterase CpdA
VLDSSYLIRLATNNPIENPVMNVKSGPTTRIALVVAMAVSLVLGFAARGEEETWRFASIPDFINFDVGSVKELPTYDGGPDSSSPEYEALLGEILDSIRAEDPEFVLVAGDLVMGHWDVDWDKRLIFGPVGTDAEKSAAIRKAGDLYYGLWKERFSSRGLDVHVALGDHEIGDNDWSALNPKSRQVGVFKDVFARHFTENGDGTPRYQKRPTGTECSRTAYAFRHRNALFVTVDVFLQRDPLKDSGQKSGTVVATVTDGQLEWLRRVLAEANADPAIDHIIVQGHVPVLRPTRAKLSSGMSMQDENGAIGVATAFWRTLSEGKVDLYLCGEVHDITASRALNVYQIAHGGIVGQPIPANYLVVEVTGNKLDLNLKSIPVQAGTQWMWQTNRNRPYADGAISAIDKASGFQTAGTMTIDKSGGDAKESNVSGLLLPVGSEVENLLVYWNCEQLVGGYLPNGGMMGERNKAQATGAMGLVSGRFGKGINFGTNAAVYAGFTPLAGAGSRTTSFWIKTSQTTRAPLLGFGEHIAGRKWELNLAPGGELELDVVGAVLSTQEVRVNDGQWHHVVLTFPGNDLLEKAVIHINGRPVASVASAKVRPDTGLGGLLALGISHGATSQQRFQGVLDDIGLWSRRLSDVEVRAVHSLAINAGLTLGECDRLLAAFRAHGEFVDVSGRRWYAHAKGLVGEEGIVSSSNGVFLLPMGNGAGMATMAEEIEPFELHLDFEETLQTHLRSRLAPSEGVLVPNGATESLGRVGKGIAFDSSAPGWEIPMGDMVWNQAFTIGFWYKRANPSPEEQVILRLRAGEQVLEWGSAAHSNLLYLETGGKRRTFNVLAGDGNWHHLVLSRSSGAGGWHDLRVVADGGRWSLGGLDAPWPSGEQLAMMLGGGGYAGRWDDIVVSRKPWDTGRIKVWHRLGRLGLNSAYGADMLATAIEPTAIVENRFWLAVAASPELEIGSSYFDELGRATIVMSTGIGRATSLSETPAIQVTEFEHREAAVELEWMAKEGRFYEVFADPTGESAGIASSLPTPEGPFRFRIPLAQLGENAIDAISIREAPGPWSPPSPELLSAKTVPRSMKLEWVGRAGFLYGIEQSEDLVRWRPANVAPLEGTGGGMVFSVPDDDDTGKSSKFFRLSETGQVSNTTPPKLTGFSRQGSSVSLEWSSRPGRQYGVLYSSGSQNWQSLAVLTAASAGETTTTSLPLPAGSNWRDMDFRIVDVTTIPLVSRTFIPVRIRLVADVRPDKSYRLAASSDLVNWDQILARDLNGPRGQLGIEFEDPNRQFTNSRFFRLEEE